MLHQDLTNIALYNKVSHGNKKIGHWVWLLIAILFYLCLFSYYYPCLAGIQDEIGFINQAIIWSKGSVTVEGAGFNHLEDEVEAKGRHVFWRNPGRSLLILPFLLFAGQQSIFISGAIIHILLTLATALILVKLEISPLYAILVLCHPTLAIYSRTIMGDTLAGLCIMCALVVLLSFKRPGKWVGLALGCAALARYQMGLLLPIMSLLMLRDKHLNHALREAIHCFAVGSGIGLIIAIYNQWQYGNVIGWLYTNVLTKQGYFDLSFILYNMAFYLIALLLIWPGMLLIVLFDSSRLQKYLHFLSFLILILLFPYYYRDTGVSFIQNIVLGQRLLQPVLPLFILSYIFVLDKKLFHTLSVTFSSKAQKLVIAGILIPLILSQVFLFQKHQAHLLKYKAMREWLSAQMPADSLVIAQGGLSKLFGVPGPDIPTYRWRHGDYVGTPLNYSATIQAEKKTWFLASLPKFGVGDVPTYFQDYLSKYKLVRVDNNDLGIILFKCEVTN